MLVFVKFQGGGDAGTVDLERGDSVEEIRGKVAAATGVHPSLQQLVFKGTMLAESDGKTVADYGIVLEEDLVMSVLPEPRTIKLMVGGVPYKALLSIGMGTDYKFGAVAEFEEFIKNGPKLVAAADTGAAAAAPESESEEEESAGGAGGLFDDDEDDW